MNEVVRDGRREVGAGGLRAEELVEAEGGRGGRLTFLKVMVASTWSPAKTASSLSATKTRTCEGEAAVAADADDGEDIVDNTRPRV